MELSDDEEDVAHPMWFGGPEGKHGPAVTVTDAKHNNEIEASEASTGVTKGGPEITAPVGPRRRLQFLGNEAKRRVKSASKRASDFVKQKRAQFRRLADEANLKRAERAQAKQKEREWKQKEKARKRREKNELEHIRRGEGFSTNAGWCCFCCRRGWCFLFFLFLMLSGGLTLAALGIHRPGGIDISNYEFRWMHAAGLSALGIGMFAAMFLPVFAYYTSKHLTKLQQKTLHRAVNRVYGVGVAVIYILLAISGYLFIQGPDRIRAFGGVVVFIAFIMIAFVGNIAAKTRESLLVLITKEFQETKDPRKTEDW